MRTAFHIAALVLLLPALAWANTVTFDPLAAGTTYSSGTYAPGDYLFSEDLADVYISEFFSGGTPYFNFARVENATAVFGSVHTMNTNNVDLLIDFTAPGDVTFEYLDMGGSINLQVNGYGAVLEAGDLSALIGTVAPGVTMNCTVVPVSGGHKGLVTLTGPVQKLRVGGQEFWVDNFRCNNGITGDPDECDHLVDHETLAPGDAWGAPYGQSPGDWIFNEDGIDVTIHELQYAGGGAGFNYCRVEVPGVPDFGFNHTMQLNNVANRYHIDALGIPVAMVKFEYLDWGGTENLQVNGGPMHIGDIDTFPVNIAPGVLMTQTVTPVGGGIRGEVVLYGEVKQLLVGGQEFFIDEVCVIEGVPLECDWLVDHETLSVGDAWGGSLGHAPGDLAFVEDGIPVHLERFVTGGGAWFNQCNVVPTLDGMGDARVMNLNNISNVYGIGEVGAWVAEVTFEFLSYGGDENIEVNGAGLFVGDIETAPVAIAPGVTYTVTTTPVVGGLRGEGRLVGQVDRLLLGGQEFYVDNICVKMHPSSGVDDRTPGLRESRLELQPNFPNPFNPRTTLGFRLEQDSDVRLTIHDAAGRLVKTLVAGQRQAGSHEVVWNGTNERGAAVAAGVYLVRVATDDGEVKTQKIGLIK